MKKNNQTKINASHGIIIIGEKEREQLHPVTKELIKAGQILAARSAQSLSVLTCNDSNPFLAERTFLPVLKEEQPSLILIGSTTFGRILGASLTASLEAEIIMDAAALRYDPDTSRYIITKASPDGRHLADYTVAPITKDGIIPPILVSVRQGVLSDLSLSDTSSSDVFLPSENDGPPFTPEPLFRELSVSSKSLSENDSSDKNTVTVLHRQKRSFSVPITEAKIILGQGRGLPGKEGAELLQKLCEKLHGVSGCSRPCADAGWQEKSHQIGQSGITVHPKLYLAFGISGAVQHMTGVKADRIIAVNRRADAPIFQYSDYGIVGDAENIIQYLLEEM